MFENDTNDENDSIVIDKLGVSPVIGVILMVAVTVALVALTTVIVFDIGGDVSESPDATVQLSETSEGVEATVLRNENVDEFELTVDGEVIAGLDTVGDSESVSIADEDKSVLVVAIMPDGTEEVLNTVNVESSGEELDGEIESTDGASAIDFSGGDSIGGTVVVDISGDDAGSVQYEFTDRPSEDLEPFICEAEEDNIDSPNEVNQEEDCEQGDFVTSEVWEDEEGDAKSGVHFVLGNNEEDDGTGDYEIEITLQDSAGNVIERTTFEFEAINSE